MSDFYLDCSDLKVIEQDLKRLSQAFETRVLTRNTRKAVNTEGALIDILNKSIDQELSR